MPANDRVKIDKAPKARGAKRPVKQVLDRLSAKMIAAIEDNAGLKPCCRKAKDHEVEFFETATQKPDIGPDMAVFTCACGARHTRFGVGGQAADNTL